MKTIDQHHHAASIKYMKQLCIIISTLPLARNICWQSPHPKQWFCASRVIILMTTPSIFIVCWMS
jgi:hypothetical protein